jgi:alkylated DNA nucleotide flippase Atl1
MRHLESFFVRRVIVGRSSGNINRILLGSVRHIRDSTNIAADLYAYLASGRSTLTTDIEIRESVRMSPFYWNGRANQRNLILQWLEESYGHRETVVFDGFTIEHVLPQTITDAWRTELQPELGDGEDVEVVHLSVVHLLGNLTLTKYNGEMSNRPYGDKRPTLASSSLQMNHEIAKAETWTREQILERCDRLAERIVTIWPGPEGKSAVPAVANSRWHNLARLLGAMPPGRWTTYGDVAAIIGTHPNPLGQRLTNHPVLNAHRVLNATGMIAPNFRWLDPSESRSGRTVLEMEGLRFDDQGRADPTQRLFAEELAELAGMDIENNVAPVPQDAIDRSERFLQQLAARQDDLVVQAVKGLLGAWRDIGGRVAYGSASETSCFLMSSPEGVTPESAWPCAIYPTGKVEIPFQYMAVRAPFDNIDLRLEFMRRLNKVDGIDMDESRVSLRPGFDIAILTNNGTLEHVVEQLSWFYQHATVTRPNL